MLKKIEFKDLQKTEYFAKDIICDFQVWKDSQSWCTPTDGRINTGIMLVLSKNAVYRLQNGEILYVYPGDIVLLPEGSRYDCTFYETSEDIIELKFRRVSRSCLFLGFKLFDSNFDNITFSGNPAILFNAKGTELIRKFDHLCKYSKQPDIMPGVFCGETLNFLSQLSSKYTSFSLKSDNDSVFDSVISYIYDNAGTVTAGDIISISGMSPSTLRRRFQGKFGVTPVTYINNLKIENAKAYFESGITKIKDVSRLCGIQDEFYFSRLFTKTVGISPTSYLKKIKNLNK